MENQLIMNQKEIAMKVNEAKEFLKSKGYYVDNLWQIDDAKSVFQCTNEQAYEIMDKVMNNERIMNEIWETITIIGEDFGYKLKK